MRAAARIFYTQAPIFPSQLPLYVTTDEWEGEAGELHPAIAEFFVTHILKEPHLVKSILVSSGSAVAGALLSYRIPSPRTVVHAYTGPLTATDIRSRCEAAATSCWPPGCRHSHIVSMARRFLMCRPSWETRVEAQADYQEEVDRQAAEERQQAREAKAAAAAAKKEGRRKRKRGAEEAQEEATPVGEEEEEGVGEMHEGEESGSPAPEDARPGEDAPGGGGRAGRQRRGGRQQPGRLRHVRGPADQPRSTGGGHVAWRRRSHAAHSAVLGGQVGNALTDATHGPRHPHTTTTGSAAAPAIRQGRATRETTTITAPGWRAGIPAGPGRQEVSGRSG